MKCSTQAQHQIRALGLRRMSDLLSPNNVLLPWNASSIHSTNLRHQRAYGALLDNAREMPAFTNESGTQDIYFQDTVENPPQLVWLFKVPGSAVSNRWEEIHTRFAPIKAFEVMTGSLTPRSGNLPAIPGMAHRILVRDPLGKTTSPTFFGRWSEDTSFLLQHEWFDGTPLLSSSTAQLRNLHALHCYAPHQAIHKWELALGCEVQANIWRDTWLPFRGAKENTFLWQLLYRSIATQHWRFPTRPATWCTRCNLEAQEDTLHCIWSCPISRQCWLWGENLLQATTSRTALQGQLQPEHVLTASPIPTQWQVPSKVLASSQSHPLLAALEEPEQALYGRETSLWKEGHHQDMAPSGNSHQDGLENSH